LVALHRSHFTTTPRSPPPFIDHVRDQSRPSRLMGGAEAFARIAVEVLVEPDEMAPVRVLCEELGLARAARTEDGAVAVGVGEENVDETLGDAREKMLQLVLIDDGEDVREVVIVLHRRHALLDDLAAMFEEPVEVLAEGRERLDPLSFQALDGVKRNESDERSHADRRDRA